jgi:hypothetical protein
MVGVINKISEDLSKIPLTNKQAYRMLFVEVRHMSCSLTL